MKRSSYVVSTATLTYPTKELKKALAAVAPYVDTKSKISVLAGVVLTPESIQATNLDAYADHAIMGQGAGEVLLPYQTVKDIIGHTAADTVTIHGYADETGHHAYIGTTMVHGYDPADYVTRPVMTDCESAMIQNFAGALQTTWPAISQDITRPVLCAARIEPSIMVATDSYRLHTAELRTEGTFPAVSVKRSMLAGLVKSKHAGPVTLTVGRSEGERDEAQRDICRITMGPLTVTGRTEPGRYPSWQQLVPVDFDHEIAVDRAALEAQVTAAAKFVGRKHAAPVRLAYNGNGHINIRAEVQDVGQYADVISCHSDQGGIEIGFNPFFLADALSIFPGAEVTLQMMDPLRPALIDDGSRRALIMPIRLND